VIANGISSHIAEESNNGEPGIIVNDHQIFLLVKLKYVRTKLFPRTGREVWLLNRQFRLNREMAVTRLAFF